MFYYVEYIYLFIKVKIDKNKLKTNEKKRKIKKKKLKYVSNYNLMNIITDDFIDLSSPFVYLKRKKT